MKILFLHPNFPGQFKRPIVIALSKGHEVVSLCHTHYSRHIKGVKRITLKGRLGIECLETKKLKGANKSLSLANQFRKGMHKLKEEGYEPDIIVSHSGFACGLHTSCIWPDSKKISYVEWWFKYNSELATYDPQNEWWAGPVNNYSLRQRNMVLALELAEADIMISPTRWQQQQLPKALQMKCKVVSDGINLAKFVPNLKVKSNKPLLTYGTRGMEAMRGFPEFIQELPFVLENYPDLHIEIAGEDKICYGGNPPKEGSYGNWAKNILDKWIRINRVKFVGRLNETDYITWLQKSWFHVHLSRPFVASWSLLESMACGSCLIASNTSPILEFLNKDNAILVDHREPGWLAKPIKKLLEAPELRKSLAKEARRQSENWNSNKTNAAWAELMGL